MSILVYYTSSRNCSIEEPSAVKGLHEPGAKVDVFVGKKSYKAKIVFIGSQKECNEILDTERVSPTGKLRPLKKPKQSIKIEAAHAYGETDSSDEDSEKVISSNDSNHESNQVNHTFDREAVREDVAELRTVIRELQRDVRQVEYQGTSTREIVEKLPTADSVVFQLIHDKLDNLFNSTLANKVRPNFVLLDEETCAYLYDSLGGNLREFIRQLENQLYDSDDEDLHLYVDNRIDRNKTNFLRKCCFYYGMLDNNSTGHMMWKTMKKMLNDRAYRRQMKIKKQERRRKKTKKTKRNRRVVMSDEE